MISQADPIKRLLAVRPDVIEQRELLTNLHLAGARTDLVPAEIPSPKRRVLPRISAERRPYRYKLSLGYCASSGLGSWALETRSVSTWLGATCLLVCLVAVLIIRIALSSKPCQCLKARF